MSLEMLDVIDSIEEKTSMICQFVLSLVQAGTVASQKPSNSRYVEPYTYLRGFELPWRTQRGAHL